MMKPQVKYIELQDLTYQEGWDFQTDIHNQLKENKLSWRHLSEEEKETKHQENVLIFCEHFPVYTLGKSGTIDNLLLTDKELTSGEIEFFKINFVFKIF